MKRAALLFISTALSTLAAPVFAQTPSVHSVTLTWDAPADATSASTATMYRAAGDCTGTPAFTIIAQGLPINKSYTDTSVSPGTYCYMVRQVQGTLQSPDSNHAPATVSLLPILNLTVTVDGSSE